MNKIKKMELVNCFVPLDVPIVISSFGKGEYGYRLYQTNLELQDENRFLKSIIEQAKEAKKIEIL